MEIDEYVISTWNEKQNCYVDLKSFGTSISARIEFYYLIGQKRYDNLVLINVPKGVIIKQWKEKNKT